MGVEFTPELRCDSGFEMACFNAEFETGEEAHESRSFDDYRQANEALTRAIIDGTAGRGCCHVRPIDEAQQHRLHITGTTAMRLFQLLGVDSPELWGAEPAERMLGRLQAARAALAAGVRTAEMPKLRASELLDSLEAIAVAAAEHGRQVVWS